VGRAGGRRAAGSLILAHWAELVIPGQEGACLPGWVSEDSMVAEKTLLTRMAGSGPAPGNGRP
jgi:hypothetical protein